MPITIPKNELNEFSLPRVCVATGQQGQVTFQKVEFQFVPKWIAVFALAPLLYLIFFFTMRKTASGTLPFSEPAWEQVKAARRNVMFAALGMVGAIVLGIVLVAPLGDVGGVIALLGFVGGLVAVVVASMRIRKVYPLVTKIDDRLVYITLPSPEAEQLISAHLTAGARSAA